MKKVLPYVSKGAVIAAQAGVNPVGAALATVELITDGPEAEDAAVDAAKALAVAIDDHEARLLAVEKALKAKK